MKFEDCRLTTAAVDPHQDLLTLEGGCFTLCCNLTWREATEGGRAALLQKLAVLHQHGARVQSPCAALSAFKPQTKCPAQG